MYNLKQIKTFIRNYVAASPEKKRGHIEVCNYSQDVRLGLLVFYNLNKY